ncbi:Jasmonoyl--L-amino acid synthetase jar6 [Ancistrocladus abbreviatus]
MFLRSLSAINLSHTPRCSEFGKGSTMLQKMKVLDVKKIIEDFKDMTSNAERVHKETLEKILEQNGQAEYLQKLRLNGRADVESFRACVPVVTHQDLEPYIQRIANGDSSPFLTGKPITTLSLRLCKVCFISPVTLWIPK